MTRSLQRLQSSQQRVARAMKCPLPAIVFALFSLVVSARGELVSSGTTVHYAVNLDSMYQYDYYDCDQAHWYGCDPYWDGCDYHQWYIYVYRSLTYPVTADRYYSVGYFDDGGNLLGTDSFWSYTNNSIQVTQTSNSYWEGCDTFFDAPPYWWYHGLAYAIVTEYYDLQSGDIDGDGVNDEYVISNANFTQENGKDVSYIDLPDSATPKTTARSTSISGACG